MTEEKKELSVIVIRAAIGVVFALIVGFLVGMNSRVDELELWKAERKANEWNSNMEAAAARETDAKFTAIRQEMSSNQKFIATELSAIRTSIAKLPSEIPPKWWVDYVKERMDGNTERIESLESSRKDLH